MSPRCTRWEGADVVREAERHWRNVESRAGPAQTARRIFREKTQSHLVLYSNPNAP